MRFRILVFILFIYGCHSTKNDKEIYIVTRSTEGKEGQIVLKYNDSEEKITHVGVAFVNREKLKVYNISYDQVNDQGSSLLEESLADFWVSPDPKNNRIWKVKVSEKGFNRAMEYIQQLGKNKVSYDFDLNTKNGLHCSELVHNVLIAVDSDKYMRSPKCENLTGIEKMAAGKDSLCFYPADFFLQYKDLEEITD